MKFRTVWCVAGCLTVFNVWNAASMVCIAADQNSPKATVSKTAKAADAWVEKISKGALAEGVPAWYDIFAALERKYGVGQVPCGVFDGARQQFFEEFVEPWALKNGYNTELTRENFMKATDLPTTWTLAGRKRQGCVSNR